MWQKLFIRLLSLSFMSCFVVGLLSEEFQRNQKSSKNNRAAEPDGHTAMKSAP